MGIKMRGSLILAGDLSKIFERTLAHDYDDDEAWEAVNALRATGTREVFEIAAQWRRSENPLKRARAADVLGQLGVGPDRPHAFPEEACDLLLELLSQETHSRPAASAIIALGHLRDGRSLPIFYKFVSHEDAVLRHAVAFALGCLVDNPASHPGLMLLMNDEDDDVRDWATFSLGVWGDQDSGQICDALTQRLGDSSENVRMEAIVGLAKRGDARVLPALIVALEQPCEPMPGLIGAACAILALEVEPEGWSSGDFASALRQLSWTVR